MKIKAVIIEDEYPVRTTLIRKIAKHCPNIQLVGEADNYEDAEELLKRPDIDLAFMDIKLGPMQNEGVQLLKKMDAVPFKVIFTTGYKEFAIDAIKLSAVDYLLKPIKNEYLVQAVEKASKAIQEKNQAERERIENEKLKLLFQNYKNPYDFNNSIAVPTGIGYQMLIIRNIIRLEGIGEGFTKVIYQENRVIINLVSGKSLKYFEERLSERFCFFRIHRSHHINLRHIVEITREGATSFVKMADAKGKNDFIRIARRRKDEFLKLVTSGSC